MNIDAPAADSICKMKALWNEAFGDGYSMIDGFFNTAFSTDRCLCAVSGDDVAAALYWFDCECMGTPVAYIYAVATSKAYRGQGICHKLMEHTHHKLKDLGCKGAVLVPGSDGLFKFYAGMGYTVCNSISEINCTASDTKTDIRLIDKREYAYLRRQFLPEGGVIQEGRNLDYLATHNEFYAGDGFLLAAHKDNKNLYGTELLGDKSMAPDILYTLGCESGKFRTAGDNRNFAMYLPLSIDAVIPKYFGLAFD